MILPFDFWDITLLLAMFSIVLVVTSGISSSISKKNLIVNKRKLKYVTMVISSAFLAMICIRIIYAYLTL